MSARITFNDVWDQLLGESLENPDYWVQKKFIPLGTLEPYESYRSKIPDEDIVGFSFDPVNTPFTKRKAMNVLHLAGSGDGKSLLMKVPWYILQRAGYYVVYIDRKSTDAGRARKAWNSKRLPKYLVADGIPLIHLMPAFNVQKDYEHMIHNFEVYNWRLSDISDRDMLQGIGMTEQVASVFTEMINSRTTLNDLMTYVEVNRGETSSRLAQSSLKNADRVLLNLKYFNMVSSKYPRLDMLKLLKKEKEVNSLVISYNNTDDKQLLTFDIGLKILQSSRFFTRYGNDVPVFFYLDDGGDYAKEIKGVEYNFAVEQIKKIGFDYRSKGIYNWLAVQSLGIIDESVAEGYPIKIISPYFRNPDSLKKINIPDKALKYLKDTSKKGLTKQKGKHLVQWLFIDEDNNVVPFYPFTPPCTHFTEVYKPQIIQKKKINESESDSRIKTRKPLIMQRRPVMI